MNKIIVVSGPTASGKTALAVELAKRYDGEVISADSMQIYTDMDVASAKATPEEQQGIPHHLMDFLDPAESFSVADWVKLAGECADDILKRGKTPVICGGTGLYISSFVDNLRFDESECDYQFREEMRKFAEENGAAALLERLRSIDPETAENVCLSLRDSQCRYQRTAPSGRVSGRPDCGFYPCLSIAGGFPDLEPDLPP